MRQLLVGLADIKPLEIVLSNRFNKPFTQNFIHHDILETFVEDFFHNDVESVCTEIARVGTRIDTAVGVEWSKNL